MKTYTRLAVLYWMLVVGVALMAAAAALDDIVVARGQHYPSDDLYPILQTTPPRVLVFRLLPYDEAAEHLDSAPLNAIVGITGTACPSGWTPHVHAPNWEATYIPFNLRVYRDGAPHDDESASLLFTCERAR